MNDRQRLTGETIGKCAPRRLWSHRQVVSLIRGAICCLLGAIVACFPAVGFVTAQDPPDRLSIKLPNGKELYFRAVYLGIDGTRLFASRRITLGSRAQSTNYKERLTETLISGGFVGRRNGKPDWLYYLGETEVQRCQWNAVMRWMEENKGLSQRPADDSRLPQTEITIAEVYAFLEALNSWMLTHERERLPKYRGAVAFCRLPTEAEWDFAARGGIKTIESNPDVYDQQHPYGGDACSYEWIRSNSGQVKECGSAWIKPNVLGLYDMLGNVEELTMNLFGPQYQWGRFGDFVVRGCDFSASDLSVAHRSEYLAYGPEGTPVRSPNIGFRVALSTRISSMQTTPQELDTEFNRYMEQISPPGLGFIGPASPTTQATDDRVRFLEDRLARIESENRRISQDLARSGQELEEGIRKSSDTERRNEDLKEKISLLEQRLKDLVNQSRVTIDMDQGNQTSLERQLEELRTEKKGLLARVNELEQGRRDEERKVVVTIQTNKDLAEQLSTKERREALFSHELAKNAGRVREVEKRYLEALMRQASANAYLGYRILTGLKHVLLVQPDRQSDPEYKKKMEEGIWMVHDYYMLVVEIAQKTQVELFPEVKGELTAWLMAVEKRELQRKALDLIDRHVREARSGMYHRSEDLVRSFPDEPEFK